MRALFAIRGLFVPRTVALHTSIVATRSRTGARTIAMAATGRWKRAHMPDVSLACALAFHALFGAVHEASHLAAALWTGRLVGVETITDTANVVAKAMLGRHVVVVAADVSDDPIAFDIDPVRHAGWVASAVVAIAVAFASCRYATHPRNAGHVRAQPSSPGGRCRPRRPSPRW